MNILLVGKKGVFETLLIAAAYLGQEPDWAKFGNLELEKAEEPLLMGEDDEGNQVYVLGNSMPERVAQIHQELLRVDDWQSEPLCVVPILLGWSWLTVILAFLANTPLLGWLFLTLARAWTLAHGQQLKGLGQALRREVSLWGTDAAAAKPLLELKG